MLNAVAEKLIRQYFYNFPTLKKKMKVLMATRGTSLSAWIRLKEREELKKEIDK